MFLPSCGGCVYIRRSIPQNATGSSQPSNSTTTVYNIILQYFSMAPGINQARAEMGTKETNSIFEMQGSKLTSPGADDFPISSRTRGKTRANKEQKAVNIAKRGFVDSHTDSSADPAQKEFPVTKRNQSPGQPAAEKSEPRLPTRKQPHRGELRLQKNTLLSIYARVLARAGPAVERSTRIATAEKQLHTKYIEMATLPFASKWSVIPTRPPPRSGFGGESQAFTRNKVNGKRFM